MKKIKYFLLQNCKKTETGIFMFSVISFEPIEIHTGLAPQNDHLNLSFVKDVYVVAKQMVLKWPFISCNFG